MCQENLGFIRIREKFTCGGIHTLVAVKKLIDVNVLLLSVVNTFETNF